MIQVRKQQYLTWLILGLAILGASVSLLRNPGGTLLQLGILGLIIYLSHYPPAWLLRLVSAGPVVYQRQPIRKLPAKKKRKFRVIDGKK